MVIVFFFMLLVLFLALPFSNLSLGFCSSSCRPSWLIPSGWEDECSSDYTSVSGVYTYEIMEEREREKGKINSMSDVNIQKLNPNLKQQF